MTVLLLAYAAAWWRTHGAAAADAARQLAALDTTENTP